MNFGQAIELLKEGHNVARKGWNGKKMNIFLNPGNTSTWNPSEESIILIEGIRQDLFELGDEDTITRLPNINMYTATGSIVTGWLASQTDILAEDWEVAF